MNQDTFINYRGYRYLWINLIALAIAVVGYAIHTPIGGPSGGTTLGYTYGGLATAGILYLTWFGIRKRSYRSSRTTLKGCLAGHIWLGILLSILVPLHAGFQFGINVHTAAYALMMGVVISGIFGAIVYGVYAPEIESHRGGGSIRTLVEQFYLLQNEVEKLTKDKSDQFIKVLKTIDTAKNLSLFAPKSFDPAGENVAELIHPLTSVEQAEAFKLASLVGKKVELARKISRESKIQAVMKVWLFLHIPLTVGLLVTLAIHIFSVFFYW